MAEKENDYLNQGQTNHGPNGGGPYDNDDNGTTNGGAVWPTEAKSMTGDLMAAMPVQTVPNTGVSTRQANEREMRGGN